MKPLLLSVMLSLGASFMLSCLGKGGAESFVPPSKALSTDRGDEVVKTFEPAHTCRCRGVQIVF